MLGPLSFVLSSMYVQCGYRLPSASSIIIQRLRVTAAFEAPRHAATAARFFACKTRNEYVRQGSPGPSDTVLLLLAHDIGHSRPQGLVCQLTAMNPSSGTNVHDEHGQPSPTRRGRGEAAARPFKRPSEGRSCSTNAFFYNYYMFAMLDVAPTCALGPLGSTA
jgi:hypothetical protein